MPAPRRVRKGASDTLTAVFYDGGETAVDKGAVTVSVASDTGTVLQTGSATNAAGVYTFGLTTAATVAVDLLTVTWTSATETQVTFVEIVDGFYFELAELRAMNDISVTYSTERLRNARRWIEDVIDTACNTSFVRRYRRDLLNSTGNASAGPINQDRNSSTLQGYVAGVDIGIYRALVLSENYVRSILSLSISGVALTAPQLAQLAVYPGGRIVRKDGGSWGYGYENVVVRYEAARMDYCPGDLRDVALQAARWRLISTDGQSGIPNRATSIQNEFGNVQLSTPKAGERPTGIPDVDAVIMTYADQFRVPGIA